MHVSKMSELEGVVDFYPQIDLISGGQSIGCIDKSFEGDIQEISGYLCAKYQRNQRGRRFLPPYSYLVGL